MQFMSLEVVARDGIEPSTRGFSIQRRAQFGASKTKNRKGFQRGRPNRPAGPNAYRTQQGPADRTPARGPRGSTSWTHHDRAGTERGRFLGAPARLGETENLANLRTSRTMSA